MRFLWIN